MDPIQFSQFDLDISNGGINGGASALQWGPDGLLYAVGRNGFVYAIEVTAQTDAQGDVSGYSGVIKWTHDLAAPNFDDFGDSVGGGSRQALGIAVTEGENGETIVYASHSDIKIGAGSSGGSGDVNLDTNSGIVTRIIVDVDAEKNVTEVEALDIIRGLPRSEENHATNGLALSMNDAGDPILLIASGGHANAGAPSVNFVGLPEYTYSASILSADLNKLAAIEAAKKSVDPDIDHVFDLPTLDDPTRPNFRDADGNDVRIDANFDGQVDSVAEFVDEDGDSIADWMIDQDGDGDLADDQAAFVATKIVDADGDGVRDTILYQDGGSAADNVTGVRGGNDGLNQAKLLEGNPVQIYSSGYRNTYDVLVTEDGRKYTYDNGANGGWGGVAVTDNGIVTNEPNNVNETKNFDNLHEFYEGFHGGHPNPTVASGSDAGLWTSPTEATSNAPLPISDWRELGDTALPSIGQEDDGLVLPADWDEVVDQNLINPAAGVYTEGGSVADGALDADKGSWNGLAEYTGTAFGGQLQGALLVTQTGGDVKWIKRDVNGNVEIQAQGSGSLSNSGTIVEAANQGIVGDTGKGNTLGIDAVGDAGVDGLGLFTNTIWVGSLGGTDKITVFVAGGEPAGADLDKDDDGIDHVADYYEFSAAQGVDHVLDPIGTTTTVNAGETRVYTLSAESYPLSAPGGIGQLGYMVNNADPSAEGGLLSADENIIPGGAGSGLQVKDIRAGTAKGEANDQRDALTFAVSPGDDAGRLEISTVMNAIVEGFYQDGSEAGLQIGTGNQFSFMSLVLAYSDEGTPALSMDLHYEEADARQVSESVDVSNLLVDDKLPAEAVVEFLFDVNTVSGLVTPRFKIIADPSNPPAEFTAMAPVQATGDVLNAMQGNFTANGEPHPLAFGNIGTSAIAPDVPADAISTNNVNVTYDEFRVVGFAPQVDGFVAISNAAVDEDAGSVTLTVTLQDEFGGAITLGEDVTVDFTLGGSAQTPDDATVATTSPLTIASGTSAATITIDIEDDAIVEGLETLEIALGTIFANGLAVQAKAGADTGIVTITDNDVPDPGSILYRVNAGTTNNVAGGDGGPDWLGDANLIVPNPTGITVSGNTGDTFSNSLTNEESEMDLTNLVSPVPWQLFINERGDNTNDQTTLDYAFDVTPGTAYTVTLYYVENWNNIFTSNDPRVFDVELEGSVPAEFADIHPLREATDYVDGEGAPLPSGSLSNEQKQPYLGTAFSRSVTYTATDNELNLSFIHDSQNPKINAIEVAVADPGDGGSVAVVSIADVTVSEGDGTATVTFSLSAPVAEGVVTVPFTVADGSAEAGGDFTLPATQEVVFDGTQTATATFAINDDDVVEGTETFAVSIDGANIAAPTGATVTASGTASDATVTIEDNDIPAPTPGEVLYRINSGGPKVVVGADDATNPSDPDVDWSADENPDATPFLVAGGPNTFGKSTGLAIDTSGVPGVPAAIFDTERWDPATGAEMEYEFAVAEGDYTVNLYLAEGFADNGIGDRVFDVAVEGSVPTVFDDIDPAAISAGLYGGDINGAFVLSHTVTVSDGTLDLDFLHDVIENPAIRGIEIVAVGDEQAQDVTITAQDVSADESTGEITITFTISDTVTAGDITLPFTLVDGSATIGTDTTPNQGGSITFPAGDGSNQTAVITLTNDDLVEGDETFTVQLGAPTALPANVNVTTVDGTATIVDDDVAAVVDAFNGAPASGDDWSDDNTQPDEVALNEGVNTLVSTGGSGDADYITFVVPEGQQVTSITLAGYSGGGNSAFLGIQQAVSVPTQAEIEAGTATLDGGTVFNVAQLDSDILPLLSSDSVENAGQPTNGLSTPLQAGRYTLWFNQNQDVTETTLEIVSGAVPGADPNDIDGDGIANSDDPFAYDGTNGDARVLAPGVEFTQDFDTATDDPFSPDGGFSGILVNPAFDYPNASGTDPYGDRTNEGKVSISNGSLSVTSSDFDAYPSSGTGADNTLADGYQSAVDVSGVTKFEVHARANSADWLGKTTSTGGFEQFGITLGAGGVDDFVKLVISDNNINSNQPQRVQLAHNNSLTGGEVNLAFGASNGPSVDLALVGDIDFRLIVDRGAGENGTVAGQVDFFAASDGALLESFAVPAVDISASSSLIPAMDGQNPLTNGDGGLAYGIFVTDWAGGTTANQITANYDFLTIRALDEASNAAPTAVALTPATLEVSEDIDTSQGSVKLADIVITDDGLGTNAIAVTGTGSELFVIVAGPNGPELHLAQDATLDAGAAAEIDVAIEVDDVTVGSTPDVTTGFTLTVTDGAVGPTLTVTPVLTEIAENADLAGVKVADIVITGDGIDATDLGLAGDDAALFQIVDNGGTLELQFADAAGLDHETNATLDVDVVLDDPAIGTGSEAIETVQLTVLDTNEAPTISGTIEAQTTAMGAALDVPLGSLTLADEDADDTPELAITIDGSDIDLVDGFSLDGTTLKVADSVAEKSYQVAVFASDGELASESSVTFVITVGAAADVAPQVELQNVVALNEDADTSIPIKVADIVVTDDNQSAVTLSVSDDASFTIQGTELFLKAGVLLDFEAAESLSVTVTATDDAGSGSAEAAIPIIDVEEDVVVDDEMQIVVDEDIATIDLGTVGTTSTTVTGTADDLKTVPVTNFGEEDKIVVTGVIPVDNVTPSIVSIVQGTTTVGIDTDGNLGDAEVEVKFDGGAFDDASNFTAEDFDLSYDSQSDQLTLTLVPESPTDPIAIEFEDVDEDSPFYVENQGAASGGQVLRLPSQGSGTFDIALSAFGVGSGVFDLALTLFDESDGASQLTVKSGDAVLAEVTLNQDGGGNAAQAANLRTVLIPGVAVTSDMVLTFEGIADSGEFVRLDKLVLTPSDTSTSNQAPFVFPDAPTDQQASEGTDYLLDLNTVFGDPDEDALTFTLIDGPSFLSISEGLLSGTPGENDVGDAPVLVTIQAFDGNDTVQHTFSLSVNDVDQPPELENTLDPVSIDAGAEIAPIDVSGLIADAEDTDAEMAWDATGLPSGLSFDPQSLEISGTPSQPGSYTIDVSATDSAGGTFTTQFFLEVVGQATTGDPVKVQAEDLALEVFVTEPQTQAEGDVIRLKKEETGTATLDVGGTEALGAGSFDVTAAVFDENDGASTLTLLVDDVEVGTVVLDLDAGGNAAQATSKRVVDFGTVTLTDTSVVKLVATSNQGEFARIDFLTFTPSGGEPVNFRPTLVPGFDETQEFDTADFGIDLLTAFSDDQEVMTFSLAAGAPDFVSIVDNALVATDAPDGTYTVTVIATDSGGLTNSRPITLTVAVPNAPVLANDIGDQTAAEDQPYAFAVPQNAFSEPDGDDISYSFSGQNGAPLPTWLSDNGDGTLTGTPTQEEVDAGPVTIEVTATDKDGTATDTFTITTENVNDAPTVEGTVADSSFSAIDGTTVTLPAGLFADQDGDLLTLSASLEDGAGGTVDLPSWLVFDAASETFAVAPGAAVPGSYEVVVTASDGALETATSFTLTVDEDGTGGAPQVVLRINAFGATVAATDDGPAWLGDTIPQAEFTLNAPDDRGDPNDYPDDGPLPSGVPDAALNTARSGSQPFTYNVPLENGTYKVVLYIAEVAPGGQSLGFRNFDATLEGSVPAAFDDITPFDTNGTSVGVYEAEVDVVDGVLDIGFVQDIKQNPIVNAIEILKLDGAGSDDAAPAVGAITIAPVAEGDGTATVSVAVSDNVGVDDTTVDTTDLILTGPVGSDLPTVTTATFANGVATYTLSAPAGGFVAGAYSVAVAENAYGDAAGNLSAASTAQSFTVQGDDTGVAPQVLLRINPGGQQVDVADGPSWLQDLPEDATGGGVGTSSEYLQPLSDNRGDYFGYQAAAATVPAGVPETVLDTARSSDVPFEYIIPITDLGGETDVTVRLYLAELFSGNAADNVRVFDVSIEGTTPAQFDDIDLADDGNSFTAEVREYDVTVTDGALNILFAGVVENPVINGIEILSQGGVVEGPVVSIGNAAPQQENGDDGTTTLTFPVTFSTPPASAVTLGYTTSLGGGTQQAVIQPGGGSITVDVQNDVIADGPDTVTVTLTDAGGLAIGTATATGSVTEDDLDGSVGAAVLAINENSNNVQQSNFGNDSFQITNVGDKKITNVTIDVTDALYPDAVFDPFGQAGDSAGQELQINTAGGTGVSIPSDPYLGAGGIQGYEGIVLNFTDFDAGETVGFRVDMDPNSIAGSGKSTLDGGSDPSWDVGGVSGAELIGSSFTVTFEDGTTATGKLHGVGNNAGSKGLATQASPELGVTLSVNGVGAGGEGAYGDDGPQVIVNGPLGETARVVLTKGIIQPVDNNFTGSYGAQLDAQLQALAASGFPANNAAFFQTVDVVLTGGNQDISDLFNFDDVPGFNLSAHGPEDQLPLGFAAAVIDLGNEDLPKGPVTSPIHLVYDADTGSGTNVTLSVAADALTLPEDGDSGNVPVSFTVSPSGALTGNVEVGYQVTLNGTITNATAILNFDGANPKIVVDVPKDDQPNGNDTVSIKLTSAAAADVIVSGTAATATVTEDDVAPSAGAFIEQNGLVVIEMESADALPGNWKTADTYSTTGSPDVNNPGAATGDDFLVWQGSQSFNSPGNGLIAYEVQISTPGTYEFQWRNQVGLGTNTSEHNDTWLKIEADKFYGEKSGSVVKPKGAAAGTFPDGAIDPNGAGANGWFKVYSSGANNWSWSTNTSDNDPHQIYADFDSPGTYTILVSARSSSHVIDRMVLSHVDSFPGNPQNLSLPESPRVGGVQDTSPTVIDPINDVAIFAGTGTSIDAAAAFDDQDGDDLDFTLEVPQSLTAEVTIDGETGLITIGDGIASGTYQITVTAVDDDSNTVGDTFQLQVSEPGMADELRFSVQAASDDWEEFGGGSPSLNLEFGLNNEPQYVGIRFDGVTISDPLQITEAYIEFTAIDTNSAAASFAIQIESDEMVAAYTSSSTPGGRAYEGNVGWTPGGWTTGQIYRTPDISALIEGVIGSDGVLDGALGFLVTGAGSREAHSFDSSPNLAPVLVIKTTDDVDPVNQPPSVSLSTVVAEIDEGTSVRTKVADIFVTDDGLGANVLSLSGVDAGSFEIDSGGLFLKGGLTLADGQLDVTVAVDDVTIGGSPDDSAAFSLTVSPETPTGALLSFQVLDTSKSIVDTLLEEGDTYVASALGASPEFSGIASDPAFDGSVLIELVAESGTVLYQATENLGPWDLDLTQQPSSQLDAGAYSLRATLFSQDNLGGTSLGVQSVGFTVTGDTTGGGTSGTLRRAIASSSDDTDQNANGGAVNLSKKDLELGDSGRDLGLRFTELDLASLGNADITDAYIEFTGRDNGGNSGALVATIKLDDTLSAPTFSSGNSPASRVDGGADDFVFAVEWSDSNVPAANASFRTTNFADEFEAFLATYATELGSSDALAFVIEDQSGVRKAQSFDGDPEDAPILVIEYDLG